MGGKQYFVTVGVKRPKTSSLCFIDLDTSDMDVYRTRDGFHIVAKLSHKFDYRFRRLRTSPKWNKLGQEVNPSPVLIGCFCFASDQHREKRKGKVQVYITESS